jgi:hypothetical protein
LGGSQLANAMCWPGSIITPPGFQRAIRVPSGQILFEARIDNEICEDVFENQENNFELKISDPFHAVAIFLAELSIQALDFFFVAGKRTA